MSILPNKSGLLIGSLIGSLIGLLFAKGSGKDLRARLIAARSPQQKFEMLFQEYLRAGKDAVNEIEGSEMFRDVIKGGNVILRELKKRAKTEGTTAVKFAQQKTMELIADAESMLAATEGRAERVVRRAGRRAAGVAAKAVVSSVYRAGRATAKVEETAGRVKRAVKRTAASAKKTVRRVTKR